MLDPLDGGERLGGDVVDASGPETNDDDATGHVQISIRQAQPSATTALVALSKVPIRGSM